jgi:hypothetical protein
MRALRSSFAAAIVACVLIGAPLLAACGGSGGSSSKGGSSGGTASSNLDTAKAVEAEVTVAEGGMAEVDAGDGTVADVYIPPNAVTQDMTVVVTPLLKAENDNGSPLVPGISVVQKGNESQHITLDSPAFVSFTMPGKVATTAKVVSYPEGSTKGTVLPTSIVTEKGATTVTAQTPGFTIFRIDAEGNGEGAQMPNYKWSIDVNDSVVQNVQGARITITADGVLHSNLMFSDMKGFIDFDVSVWYQQGAVWAKLDSSTIEGDAEITSSALRIINKKKFNYSGYGKITFKGNVSLDASGGGPGMSMSDSESASASSSAALTIRITSSLPGKQNQSIPATMEVSQGGKKLVFKCKVIRQFGKE